MDPLSFQEKVSRLASQFDQADERRVDMACPPVITFVNLPVLNGVSFSFVVASWL